MSARQIKLNFHANSAGAHAPAWKRPYASEEYRFGIAYYQTLAKIAEKGLFDAIFFADMLALPSGLRRSPVLDAVVVATAVAAVTEKIGVVATSSTTFNEPYNVARQFSTLDHISDGRAGWNAVTSYMSEAASNYGMATLPPRGERYKRAEEFVEVVRKLWDSWDYAALRQPSDNRFRHPTAINHVGDHFSVQGPLQAPFTPQGRPIIFQAGGSEEGRSLAARHADGVFSAALTIPDAKQYYDDVKQKALRFNRSPDAVMVLPGVYVYLAPTKSEAENLRRTLQSETDPQKQFADFATKLSVLPGELELDRPVPEAIIERAIQLSPSRGHIDALVSLLRRNNLSVRDFLLRQPVSGPHRVVIGTAEDVANSLEEWFVEGAADGFNVGNMGPDDLALFVKEVVPLLQKRGLYRRHYSGSTLRDHYFSTKIEADEKRIALSGRA